MRRPQVLRRILYGEVQAVDRGTESLRAMRDRDSARERERAALRERELHQAHPLLPAAVVRRLRVK